MNGVECFFDTSVLLYLLSSDTEKADRVEELLEHQGVISVQVLNEFAAVASRKLGMRPPEIREVLETIRVVCRTDPLIPEDHDRALEIMEGQRFALHDAVKGVMDANNMLSHSPPSTWKRMPFSPADLRP